MISDKSILHRIKLQTVQIKESKKEAMWARDLNKINLMSLRVP
jgi:hypothetical protein